MAADSIPSTKDGDGRVFDFVSHRRDAVDAYEKLREFYNECAQAVRSVLKTALDVEEIQVQSIEARGKSIDSFGEKCERQADDDPSTPKYPRPLEEITDLSGVRVIVFLRGKIDEVSALIDREFNVLTREQVVQNTGYRGVHFLVTFSDKRDALPEYRRFVNRVTEIQVRTVLQHAWAEVEHGIVYKSKTPASEATREQLADLAGALRVADRGLQDVSSENEQRAIAESTESD